jgi:hypothetical protein
MVSSAKQPSAPVPQIIDPRDGKARIRGSDPIAALSWVHKHHRKGGMERLLRHLPDDDVALLAGLDPERRLTMRGWVPFALHCRLLRAIDTEFGAGDLGSLFDVGLFMSQRDVPLLFRRMAKLGKPGWIVDFGTNLWRFFHDEGRWELERGPVEIMARLVDRTEADAAFCHAFMGWITGALELSGARNVQSSHAVCMANGAASCVFVGRWEAGSAPSPIAADASDEEADKTRPELPGRTRTNTGSTIAD